jgi:hypothetical protein
MKYIITNKKDNEHYYLKSKDSNEARHWVINHLDLSKEWKISDFLSEWWYKTKEEK